MPSIVGRCHSGTSPSITHANTALTARSAPRRAPKVTLVWARLRERLSRRHCGLFHTHFAFALQ
jgi:hypothetical protein